MLSKIMQPNACRRLDSHRPSSETLPHDGVINLSADSDRVIAEAFRVLKPGGRFAGRQTRRPSVKDVTQSAR
jgi:SAM-dependent methyltransferase